MSSRQEKEEFEYGKAPDSVVLAATVLVFTCEDCGLSFTDDTAEEARHAAVCAFLNVLAPSEIIELRQRYTMTRAQFSSITRIGEASLARWETGNTIQNAAMDSLLFLTLFPENIARLRVRHATPVLADSTWSPKFRVLRVSKELERAAASFSLRS